MTGEADRGRGCVAFVSSSACPTCHRLFLEACPLYPVSSSEIVRAGWWGGGSARHLFTSQSKPWQGPWQLSGFLKRLRNQSKMARATQTSGLV